MIVTCKTILTRSRFQSVRNLCSGYSYCTSFLETFYVWHGRGSSAAEQSAALAYAKQLASSEENIVQLTEDESQEEEMFWMMLGDGDYANADYWKWRSNVLPLDPRIWVVDASQNDVVSFLFLDPSAAFVALLTCGTCPRFGP